MSENILTEDSQDELATAVAHSRESWRRLWMSIRSITPSSLARLAMILGMIGALTWLVTNTWISLLPFIIGGVLAYIMTPIVNFLDRFLPRWFAAFTTMLGVTAIIVLMIAQFVPFFARQIYFIVEALPSQTEVEGYAGTLEGYITQLPDPLETAVTKWTDNLTADIRERVDSYIASGLDIAWRSLLGLFNAVGFVFGFLVVPTWLLTVLNDQQKARQALNTIVPERMQTDVWSVIRIIDSTFSTFVQGHVFLGVVVGLLSYFGFSILEQLFEVELVYQVAISMFAGFMAIIPQLGPILGALPLALLALLISPAASLYVIGMFVVIWQIVGRLMMPLTQRKLDDINPALLIIFIVAISELGILWVLIAAPLIAVLRDLFRYVYGRFSDPPVPAGILPGEPIPPKATDVSSSKPIPLAYRRSRAIRQTRKV